jgi:2,4-dienoyl-CoA reductase-like NADH-dependent reductase (Old Yellow Enzyme family)
MLAAVVPRYRRQIRESSSAFRLRVSMTLAGFMVEEMPRAKLFQSLTMRGVTMKNRIIVSPMSMYSSHEGFADDFHLVHLGRFALGGAGVVMMEATAVTRQGRITHGCNGLWLDAHVPNLRRIADFVKAAGSTPAIQLGHSGPKGSAQRPWHGNGPLAPDDAAQRKEHPWPLVSSSPIPFDDGWAAPQALSEADMDVLVRDYRLAARRALDAGFEVLELHCAHGYLLHAFLSPLVNQRNDAYGGSVENRMRFPLRVAEAVRDEWPDRFPMFIRISAVDGVGVGWSIDDSIVFSRLLASRGIDAISCSSGGVKLPRGKALVSREPGFQVSFAARIREGAGIPTIAVGLIREPQHAEDILAAGDADLVALGREMLVSPNWAGQAALALLDRGGWDEWPDQFRWWLERRARQIAPRQG